MRFSIRYQLMLPLLALMLGLLAASVWSAGSAGRHARERVEKQIDDIATTVNAVSFPLNAQTLHLMKGLSGAEFLMCDQQGRPILDAQGEPIATIAETPAALPAPEASLAQHFGAPVRIGATPHLCGGVPLRQGGRPGAILYVFYPESLLREAEWDALRPALTLGIVVGAISVVLTIILAQRFSRRIRELERRTRLIADGDFSPMTLPARNDELRDLGRSVNEMAEQLAAFQATIEQTERLRLLGQVGGGLAHQLRNGVAGARLAIQLHAQETPTPPHDTESLTVALRQLSLVEMHLKKFLDLGKAVDVRRQPCELGKILGDTLALVGPQCRHGHIDLRVPSADAPAVPLWADPTQLEQLFLNVITNAIEAAGPGGWVEVRWRAASERACIEVRDSGPGPTPDVAARLFEPFVTGKREGVGLGLAVARQIAMAHGGAITWRRADSATCFRIELDRGAVCETTIKVAP